MAKMGKRHRSLTLPPALALFQHCEDPRPHSEDSKSLATDCSPTGSEVWQGPVEGQPVTEVGVVAVVLELLQGHTPAFGAELLTPVCKQGGVREGLSLCLFRLGRSLWRKKGQGDSGSECNPAYADSKPFPFLP